MEAFDRYGESASTNSIPVSVSGAQRCSSHERLPGAPQCASSGQKEPEGCALLGDEASRTCGAAKSLGLPASDCQAQPRVLSSREWCSLKGAAAGACVGAAAVASACPPRGRGCASRGCASRCTARASLVRFLPPLPGGRGLPSQELPRHHVEGKPPAGEPRPPLGRCQRTPRPRRQQPKCCQPRAHPPYSPERTFQYT